MVTSLPGYLATIHKAQPDEKKNLSSARLLGWNFLFLMSAQPHLEKAARWEHLGTNTKTCSEKKKESLNSSLRIAFFFYGCLYGLAVQQQTYTRLPKIYRGVQRGSGERKQYRCVLKLCTAKHTIQAQGFLQTAGESDFLFSNQIYPLGFSASDQVGFVCPDFTNQHRLLW